MTAEQDRAQRLDLIATVREVLTTHSEAPVALLSMLVVNAVEDWCLDDRFSSREKWIRFNARRRRGMAGDD